MFESRRSRVATLAVCATILLLTSLTVSAQEEFVTPTRRFSVEEL